MCPEAMGSAMIEPVQHTAMIACEGNNKLLVVHMQSMRVTASDSLGEDPDVLAFDDGSVFSTWPATANRVRVRGIACTSRFRTPMDVQRCV